MSDAPERIWAVVGYVGQGITSGEFSDEPGRCPASFVEVEYIRADLHQAALDRAEADTAVEAMRASLSFPDDIAIYRLMKQAKSRKAGDMARAVAAGIAKHYALWPLPTPATMTVQCCMCGKKGLSTVEGDGGTECELPDGRWVCGSECWEVAGDLALGNPMTVAQAARVPEGGE